MNDTQQAAKYLAKNITTLRSKKNFSQLQLAKLAGIPRSTLTHIESGEGNPSLSNLVKVSSALGVSVEELLSRPRLDIALIPANKVKVYRRSQDKIRVFKLLPDKIKGLEIDRVEFEPHANMPGFPHLAGTKEYMTVTQGEVTVHVGGEAYTVAKGDVFAFPGNQPHSYQNKKSTPAIAFSVVIPVPANA